MSAAAVTADPSCGAGRLYWFAARNLLFGKQAKFVTDYGMAAPCYKLNMELDDQLRRYFGTSDIESISPAAITAGAERLLVDFGLEKDRDRRFALWTLMYMLGVAPDLDVAFKDAKDRDAARDFMELTEQSDNG